MSLFNFFLVFKKLKGKKSRVQAWVSSFGSKSEPGQNKQNAGFLTLLPFFLNYFKKVHFF